MFNFLCPHFYFYIWLRLPPTPQHRSYSLKPCAGGCSAAWGRFLLGVFSLWNSGVLTSFWGLRAGRWWPGGGGKTKCGPLFCDRIWQFSRWSINKTEVKMHLCFYIVGIFSSFCQVLFSCADKFDNGQWSPPRWHHLFCVFHYLKVFFLLFFYLSNTKMIK